MLYSEVHPTEPSWVWKGHILAEDVSMLVGEEKSGKGNLGCDVAVRQAMGWPMPPYDPHDPDLDPELFSTPGYVIMITPEDKSGDTVVHRLIAGGATKECLGRIDDMSKVSRGRLKGNTTRRRFSLPQDIPLLHARIQELGDVRLVIMDPLLAVATTTISFNQQVRMNIIDPLQEVAEETGVAIWFTNHTTKGATVENIRDHIFGSKGITGALRCASVIIRDKYSDIRTLSMLNNNLLPEDAVAPLEFRICGEPPQSYIRYR